MKAAGFPPDDQAAETYLSAVVGEHGPKEAWTAFLRHAPQMQADLEARGRITFRPFMSAPDYQSESEGAALGGRALEPMTFHGRLLGSWFEKLAEPMRELTVFGGMMVTRAEAQRLIRAERSPSAILEGIKLLARHAKDRRSYRRGTRLVMGNALVGRLLHETLARGGRVFTDTTVHEIQSEAGRAVAVSGNSRGRSFRLRARAGIVLAGGGFPADPEMRREHLPPATPDYTPAAANSRGSTIKLGLAAGGRLGPDAGSNTMWFPSSLWTRPDGGLAVYPHIALDRAKPGSIIVDQQGVRFASEALSYHDFCTAMFRRGPSASPA